MFWHRLLAAGPLIDMLRVPGHCPHGVEDGCMWPQGFLAIMLSRLLWLYVLGRIVVGFGLIVGLRVPFHRVRHTNSRSCYCMWLQRGRRPWD